MSNTYSPFDRSFKNLTCDDLLHLKQTHEGWYVEYKSEMVSSSAIAKGVSAFANKNGGWLFFGVKEESASNSVAGEFPGLDIVEKDKIRQKIRSSCNAYLEPTPYYDVMFIDGPCKELELPENKTIAVLQIPKSMQTPHIHKDGRIYIRVSDSSEPKPETDPHLLASMFKRREKADEAINLWLGDGPEISEAESEWPQLRLLLTPDVWGQQGGYINATNEEIRDILKGKKAEDSGVTLPMNTVHSTSNGFIGRQVTGTDPSDIGISFQINRQLECEINFSPTSYKRFEDVNLDDLSDYLYVEDFVEILSDQNFQTAKVIDLNIIYQVLLAVTNTYLKLLRLGNCEPTFYAKIILLNGWRYIPFYDDKDVMEQFRTHGIPVLQSEHIMYPFGKGAESFLKVSKGSDDLCATAYSQAFEIMEGVFTLLGIDVYFGEGNLVEQKHIDFANLFNAGERTKKTPKKP